MGTSCHLTGNPLISFFHIAVFLVIFIGVKGSFAVPVVIRGFKNMIWLVEWEKIIVLHVRHAFWWNFFLRSLPNDDIKFSYWLFFTSLLITLFWRQRDHVTANLSSFAFTWKTIRAKQAEVHCGYFVQREIIANTSPNAKLYFQVTFSLWQPSKLIELPFA